MVAHWCKEHKTVFFKKGSMKGFAHPILDDDGTPTGQWCNEPKAEESTEPQQEARPNREAQIQHDIRENMEWKEKNEERRFWWHEFSEFFRAGTWNKDDKGAGSQLWRLLVAQGCSTLEIKFEKEVKPEVKQDTESQTKLPVSVKREGGK